MTKEITLKITKPEFKTLIRVWEGSSYINTDYSLIKIVKDNESVIITNIDKFREFINQAQKNNLRLRNTMSITNKLNRELYGENWKELCWEVNWDYSKLDKLIK